MRRFQKAACLVLALLMTVAVFAACGDGDETTASTSGNNDFGIEGITITVPDDVKFPGEELVFFVRDDTESWKNEMDVEKTTNDTLYDAVYYRNLSVEDRLGIEIKQIGQAGTWGSHDAWNQTLRNAVLTKSGDYDAAAIYASTGSALSVEGLYYNMLDLPHINLKQPWWNKSIINETTLFDTLYYLAGDIAVTETSSGVCIFYNKDLFNELYQTNDINLYDVVAKGEWTIDYLTELVNGAWTDTNSDGIISDGDVVGFRDMAGVGGAIHDGWVPALGVNITTMVDGYPELTFYNEETVKAFEKLQTLYKAQGTLRIDSPEKTLFTSGNQLFALNALGSGESYRDMTDKYGVLPLPKYNAEQKEYRTTFQNHASLIVVLSTCTATEKVGAALELLGAESYRQVTPAYFEVCLQGKYSDAPEDALIYDQIIRSFVFNFGFCYSTQSLAGIGSLFRDMDQDLAQTYAANKVKYETALEELIDKLDELSFNMGI